MLKNYIKVALRNIRKNKLYAFLNMLGLSVGLATFFIIYLFLQNEFAYDAFHPKADRTYRVVIKSKLESGVEYRGEVTTALAPATSTIPEIEAWSRISLWPKSVSTKAKADSAMMLTSLSVDPGFLNFFHLEFLAGSAEKALENEQSVLINATRAQQLFGSTEALGETLLVNGQQMAISGVFKDIPPTSSLKAELIAPLYGVNAWRKGQEHEWNASYGDEAFFLLSEGADVKEVEAKLNELYDAQYQVDTRDIELQAMTDIHFSIGVKEAIPEKSDPQYILVFTLVAGFILLCSIFNYISLALSQSIERVKEIGVRRVVGAVKWQLLWQFVIESVVYILCSFVMALIMVELLTPELEALIERKLSLDIWSYPGWLIKGLSFSILVAIVSALYPALFVSRFRIVNVLKKNVAGLSSHKLLNVISVFQLVVFMVLISAAFTANRQLHFLQNENLGFDKEAMMVVNVYTPSATNNVQALKNEISQISSVAHVSHTQSVPTRVSGTSSYRGYDFKFYHFDVDEYFFETMGMELKEGRGFLPEDFDQKDLVIVNETAATKLNFEGTAVGKTIKRGAQELRIIGVVNDFHFGSKKEPIAATLFRPISRSHGMLLVKLNGQNLKQSVDAVSEVYSEIAGGETMSFSFLDEAIDAQYKQETIMIKVINSFTIMATVVAFIGLFGISGYAVKRRVKEMGIRKILGANFMAIQKTLNASNVVKMIIALMIALPLIVIWMNSWLQSFVYRIEFPVKLVGLACLMATVVILLTISIHSIRTYFINPVDVLKDE